MEKKEKQKKRLLVISEKTDTQIYLSNLLKADGYRPLMVSNEADAMKHAEKQKPDIIILNIPMSDKKGIRIFIHFKTHQSLKTIPVIVVSLIDRKIFDYYLKTALMPSKDGNIAPEAFFYNLPEVDELLTSINMLLFPTSTESRMEI